MVALTACGGDDTRDTSDPSLPDQHGETDGDGAAEDALGGAVITSISGEDICARLPGADLGVTLGLTIDEAVAYDTATPQCTYSHTSGTGSTSSVTVASLRADGDLGGRSGDEAFDYVVDINRGLAGGTDFEEVELDAGDRAVRFSGEALHLGIVFAGGHLFTVIVPVGDADAGRVDDLLERVVDRLAG